MRELSVAVQIRYILSGQVVSHRRDLVSVSVVLILVHIVIHILRDWVVVISLGLGEVLWCRGNADWDGRCSGGQSGVVVLRLLVCVCIGHVLSDTFAVDDGSEVGVVRWVIHVEMLSLDQLSIDEVRVLDLKLGLTTFTLARPSRTLNTISHSHPTKKTLLKLINNPDIPISSLG